MSSFGEDLKRERELRKISLREIAESTKINIRYLDALENNDFKHLPGGVFNKGFVRAFAQHIGVDEEDMVNAYLLEEQAQNQGTGTAEGEHLRGNFGDRFSGTEETHGDKVAVRSHKRLLIVVTTVLAAIVVLVGGWILYSGRSIAPEETGTVEDTTRSPEPDRAVPDPPPDPEPEETAETEPEKSEPATVEEQPAATPVPVEESSPGPLEIEILLVRPTNGRLNCDNRQVELLDRLMAGVTLSFRCERFLVIDADDGGALMVTIGNGKSEPLAEDGVPMRQHRLTPERRVE